MQLDNVLEQSASLTQRLNHLTQFIRDLTAILADTCRESKNGDDDLSCKTYHNLECQGRKQAHYWERRL